MDSANKVRGAISVKFDRQIALRVHYFKRDEVYFTALPGRRNCFMSRMLFSELYKIVVNKVIFVSFRGEIAPLEFAPVSGKSGILCQRRIKNV